MLSVCRQSLIWYRIVEYATRDQAQNAVNTLSNQNLMGRLVYVREVCHHNLVERLTVKAHFSSRRTVKQSPVSAAVVKVAVCVVASKEACAAALAAATMLWVVALA
jgi:RNA recognition motif-containing protein